MSQRSNKNTGRSKSTARKGLLLVYKTVGQLSVCLSVHPIICPPHAAVARLLLSTCQQETSIDSSVAARRQAAAAVQHRSKVHSSKCKQCHVDS